MHYLVVAKVEDYFDVEILMNALTFHDSTRDDQSLCGKWEKIADSVEDIATSEKDEINEVIDNDDISFKDKVLTYIELCGFRLGYDGITNFIIPMITNVLLNLMIQSMSQTDITENNATKRREL